jgi:hypothetical protein
MKIFSLGGNNENTLKNTDLSLLEKVDQSFHQN